MSRRRRELRLEAEERWPTLFEGISWVWNEDQSVFYENEDSAIKSLATEHPLQWRQQFIKEWRECDVEWGHQSNFHVLLQDGLNMNRVLKDNVEGRQLWSKAYDTVIDSVRAEFKTSGEKRQ
ncbi:hypothetical protein [Parasphingorhabdus sp.]|uniref:hypothetical protein n=1 Tax=Parasphingorhabdus sp. TaxID=2709688 RepID=UPI002B264BFE|nr:hypothetical protein [Parasphingorhabdus sp.]